MYKLADILFYYTETPLHAGTGSSMSAIDLPIQREVTTEFPMIQASGTKGVLRDLLGDDLPNLTAENIREAKRILQLDSPSQEELRTLEKMGKAKEYLEWEILFGPDTTRAEEHGGSLATTDARLLLFPVRSMQGVFVWITCPLAIGRLVRDLEIAKSNSLVDAIKVRGGGIFPLMENWKQALVGKTTVHCVCSGTVPTIDGKIVILEDMAFTLAGDRTNGIPEEEKGLKQFAEWLSKNAFSQLDSMATFREHLQDSLVLVSDEVFRDFVVNSTEVVQRIKIDHETGVVDKKTGGLWTVENLPSESLLYSHVLGMNPPPHARKCCGIPFAEDVLKKFHKNLMEPTPGTTLHHATLQLGGDQTVGRGLLQVVYFEGFRT